MAFNTKGITIEINGETQGFDAALRKIKSEVQGVDREMNKLSKAMKDDGSFKLFSAHQSLTADKVANLKKQLKLNGDTIAQVKQQYVEACDKFGDTSKEAEGLRQKLQYLESESALLESQISKLSSTMIMASSGTLKLYNALGNISAGAEKAYQALKPISTLSFAAIAGAAATTISFEDAWTGVLKTVNGTPAQLESIDRGMRELALSTASSYEELAGMGEIAGQMGVATDSVLGFVETMAKLGDTTNLTGEEAASAMAKIANIMVDADQRTTDYYERFGSAVVDLGNNFATTESDIVAMTTRLASAGRASGMSTQEILALSTALSSMGIEAAAGGGSMSKLMTNISKSVANTKAGSAEAREELTGFAEVAGMTADEFVKAWGDDAGQAFMKLMEGIGNSEDVLVTMNKLGIDTEIRMSNGVRALAQSTDVYADAMQRSNAAWEENTALTAEADKRYATVKSSLIQAKEAIKQAADALGQSFAPILKDMANKVKDFCVWLSKLDRSTIDTVAKLLTFAAAAAPVAKGVSKIASGARGVIKAFTGVNKIATGAAKVFGVLDSAVAENAKHMSKSTQALLKGNAAQGEATVSVMGLVKAFAQAHPAIAGVTATVGALGAGYAILSAAQKKYIEGIIKEREETDAAYRADRRVLENNQKLIDTAQSRTETMNQITSGYSEQRIQALYLRDGIKELYQAEHNSAGEKAQIKAMVDQLNSVLPDLNLQYDENTGILRDNSGAAIENAGSLDQLIQKQLEAARSAALVQEATERELQKVESKRAYDEAIRQVNKYTDEVEKCRKKEIEINDKINKLYEEGYGPLSDKVQELTNQWSSLQKVETTAQEQLKNAQGQLAEVAAAMTETTTASLQSINDLYTQAGDSSKVSAQLAETMNGMVQEAAKSGIQIPQQFGDALKAGAPNAAAAIDFISQFVTFSDLIQSGSIAGGAVTAEMAQGILNGCPDIQSATNFLSSLVEFSSAIEQAGLSGAEIPKACIENILQGLADGTITVQTAANQAAEAVKNPDKWAASGTSNAEAANSAQSAKMSEGAAQAQAKGQEAATAYTNGFNGALSNGAAFKISNPLITNPEWSASAFETKGNEAGTGLARGLETGTQGVEGKVKSAMDKGANAVKSSTIDTEAMSKATKATSDFGSNLKLETKATNESSKAARAISGSNIASSAGSAGSSATASFSRNLNLVSVARSQYNSVKAMIDELNRMASNPIRVQVTKEIKTVEVKGDGKKKAPARRMMSAPSAEAMDAAMASANYAVTRAATPTQTIADALMAPGGVFGRLNERMNSLASRFDAMASMMNLDKISDQLDAIAKARGVVNMDGSRVGEIVWKPVQSAQAREAKVREMMMGVR